VKETLHKIAQLVQLFIMTSLFLPPLARWNDRFHPALLQLVEDTVSVVRKIGDASLASDEVDEVFGDGGVMLLTGSDYDLQWFAIGVDGRVDLAGEASARSSDGVFLGPPLPPDAS
jgi:hypothetical protein